MFEIHVRLETPCGLQREQRDRTAIGQGAIGSQQSEPMGFIDAFPQVAREPGIIHRKQLSGERLDITST